MKLTVFKNQYGFSTLAKNGEDKMYISIQFKKGQEPNLEKAKIEIKDAFFSMYKNRVGIAFPKLVIMDYTIIENNQEQHGEAWEDPNAVIDNSDLPF